MRAADLVIVHGRGPFSALIRRFSDPAEGVRATHVAVAVSPTTLVEALPGGVVERPYRTGSVYRPTFLSDGERLVIAARARSFVGRPYGWSKILLHALGLQRFSFLDGYPICSWVASSAYAQVGHAFGVPAIEATPDDVEDHVLANPSLFRFVPQPEGEEFEVEGEVPG